MKRMQKLMLERMSVRLGVAIVALFLALPVVSAQAQYQEYNEEATSLGEEINELKEQQSEARKTKRANEKLRREKIRDIRKTDYSSKNCACTACQITDYQAAGFPQDYQIPTNPPNKLACQEILDGLLSSNSNLSQSINILRSPQCKLQVRNCGYYKDKQAVVELDVAIADYKIEKKELDDQMKDLRKDRNTALRKLRNCPMCMQQMMAAANRPPEPGFGDYLIGGIQALTPALGMYLGYRSQNKYFNAYNGYLEQCRVIGIPCYGPGYPGGMYGGGMYGGGLFAGGGGMFGFPGFRGGFQGGFQMPGFHGGGMFGFPGFQGGFHGGGHFGFPGFQGGFQGGFQMPGFHGGFQMPGFVGGGQFGYPGMMGGGYFGMMPQMGFNMGTGFGYSAYPFGTGFQSGLFPMGAVGGGQFNNGFQSQLIAAQQAQQRAYMEYRQQQQQRAAAAQRNIMLHQQNVYEAQQRMYQSLQSYYSFSGGFGPGMAFNGTDPLLNGGVPGGGAPYNPGGYPNYGTGGGSGGGGSLQTF